MRVAAVKVEEKGKMLIEVTALVLFQRPEARPISVAEVAGFPQNHLKVLFLFVLEKSKTSRIAAPKILAASVEFAVLK